MKQNMGHGKKKVATRCISFILALVFVFSIFSGMVPVSGKCYDKVVKEKKIDTKYEYDWSGPIPHTGTCTKIGVQVNCNPKWFGCNIEFGKTSCTGTYNEWQKKEFYITYIRKLSKSIVIAKSLDGYQLVIHIQMVLNRD
jgi:hypothetical protein